jgi:hypothetical protein
MSLAAKAARLRKLQNRFKNDDWNPENIYEDIMNGRMPNNLGLQHASHQLPSQPSNNSSPQVLFSEPAAVEQGSLDNQVDRLQESSLDSRANPCVADEPSISDINVMTTHESSIEANQEQASISSGTQGDHDVSPWIAANVRLSY